MENARLYEETRNSEEALRESEAKYRELADFLPQTVFEFDLSGNFTFANRYGFEAFGYTKEDFDKGLNALQMLIPEDRDRARENIQKRLRGEELGIIEYTALTKDGSTFPALLYSAPIIHDNKPVGLRGILVDITERKRMEEALRESEEKLRLMFESATDGIAVTDLNGVIIEVNERTLEMYGTSSKDEALGKSAFEFIAQHDRERAMLNMQKTLEEGSVKNLEYTLLRADGSEYPGELDASVLKDASGNPVGFIAIIRDITERKRAEETIQRKLRFEQVIYGISSRFIRLSDIDEAINVSLADMGRLSGANCTYLFLFREDGITMDNTHEWCAEGVSPQIDNLQNIPCDMFPWWMGKLRKRQTIHIKDVSKMPASASAEKEVLESQDIKSLLVLPVYIGGKLAGFIGFDNVVRTGERTGEDLSLLRISSGIIGGALERRQAEKELTWSRQQLRNLSAHLQSLREAERTEIAREIHDELGQVLTALKIDLSWLGKRLPKEPEALLEKIKSMSQLADAIIQRVKRISTELRPGLLDDLGLAAAIEWQAEEFQNRTGTRCQLSLELEDTLLDKECTTTVFRIFQETLTNITRHAHATRVKVSLRREADRLVLKVRDNGIGIEKAEITSPKSFGLMGIQERARYLGGEAKISGILGKGTTVTVSIPLDREEETQR